MVLPQFDYIVAQSLEEASNLLAEMGPVARVMAGGTDLIIPMKDHALKPEPQCLIDLKKLEELNYLEYDEKEGLKIGALTTLRALEFSPLVRKVNPAISAATKSIASTQIRAKGTMIGNICAAVPSCDSGPILMASEAKVLVFGPEGRRELKIGEFFKGPKKNALEKGEIVTGIVIPPLANNQRSVYFKHAVRKAMDLAIVGVALVLTVENGVCADARIGLGAVAATPVRAPKAEEFIKGKALDDDTIEACAQLASECCTPISDIRASKEYRSAMVKVFTKRAFKQALANLQEG